MRSTSACTNFQAAVTRLNAVLAEQYVFGNYEISSSTDDAKDHIPLQYTFLLRSTVCS